MVRGSWMKPGAIVIDVGTSPVEVSYDLERLFITKCSYLASNQGSTWLNGNLCLPWDLTISGSNQPLCIKQ